MSRFLPLFVVLFSYFLCAGCAMMGSATQHSNVAPREVVDPAEAKLAEAAHSISQSLNDIAEIQQAATPPSPDYHPADPASYGMANLASIDWAGPIEPLVKQIASSTEYKVRFLGTPPAVPIMIYISAKNQQLGDILRDIGFQSANKANIVVFPQSRIIELRYVPV